MGVKHAWLLKIKPNNYYTGYIFWKTVPMVYCTMHERAIEIASLWIGINGEIFTEITCVTDLKDKDEKEYVYLGEVIRK